ncbi:sensor histidine kinase [Micromonospora fluostatini]|uniref:Oxygen sensor histidine kinase NreB n=1 Tax=Micromonospora fluostatini TaxID=1629071 RepID=A0ABY2DJ59_9ACTN|nr:sensor histidine kinase [Micromonospora fluostatini]
MTSAAEQATRDDTGREQELRLYRLVPYGGLAVGMVLSILAPVPGAPPAVVHLTVAVAVGCWIAWFITLHPDWLPRRRLMAVYFLGLTVFCAVLVSASPWYGFVAWVGLLHSYLVLHGRWRLVGVGVTAMLVATAQSVGPPTSPGHLVLWSVLALFNVGMAVGITRIDAANTRQHQQRKQLVEELAETNRRLAETMRENEGLHAQLLTQAREAGVLDERQRMAREIHDTLAQGLAGIITQLEAAGQARERRADWQRHVDNAETLARESLTEARRSVRAVRPEPLERARLPEVLADLVDRWSTINQVRGDVHVTGTPSPLHPEVEVTLLRTAQEALANVARHAGANRVGLTLSYMKDLVTLDVRDDGAGFDGSRPGPARPDGGFGLAAMRQRVTGVGGRLEIESEPGNGTAVSASVPALPGLAA